MAPRSPRIASLAGREIRRIGFGSVRILGPDVFGPPASADDARAVLRQAARVTDLIDTADCYGPEISETLIGETLRPYRSGLLIATKGGQWCPRPGVWEPDGHPEALRRACTASLRRLGLDCIPLYQLHVVDPAVPIAESVGALSELRDEGLVEHVGLCNVGLDEIEAAGRIVPIASVQNRCSVFDRGDEAIVEFCEQQGIPFLPWFPLGRGTALSNPAVAVVAERAGASAAQVALSWLLTRSSVMVPIPGTSSLDHLAENVESVDVILDEDDIAALEVVAGTHAG